MVQFSLPLPASATSTAMVPDGAPDEAAAQAVAGLERGGRVVGMTKGQFSLLDLIRAIMDKIGEPVDLALSTWTVGIRDAESAALLLDTGRLSSFRLYVDRSFATRQPAYCAAVRQLFGDSAIRTTNTHAKIALIRGGGWSVTVRSSMNLNRNPRFENFDVDDSEQVAAFFAAHFDEMTETIDPGPVLPCSVVTAVFSRLARGIPPFDIATGDELAAKGVPIYDGAEAFGAWVRGRIEDEDGLMKLARSVGIGADELERLLGEDSAAWMPVACDVAGLLAGHKQPKATGRRGGGKKPGKPKTSTSDPWSPGALTDDGGLGMGGCFFD